MKSNHQDQNQEKFEGDVIAALDVLSNGGLILYPTDTVWGIGCDATNAKAVEQVFKLKNRSDNKAMIILVADERDVLQYVANPDFRVFDYINQTTRPVTVIYEGAIGLADNLTGKDGSVAIRITYDLFCRHLIKRFRKPIVSTSANISGQFTPRTFAEIPEEIKKGVDYVVKFRQDDAGIADPSSLIKWNKDGTLTVIRR